MGHRRRSPRRRRGGCRCTAGPGRIRHRNRERTRRTNRSSERRRARWRFGAAEPRSLGPHSSRAEVAARGVSRGPSRSRRADRAWLSGGGLRADRGERRRVVSGRPRELPAEPVNTSAAPLGSRMPHRRESLRDGAGLAIRAECGREVDAGPALSVPAPRPSLLWPGRMREPPSQGDGPSPDRDVRILALVRLRRVLVCRGDMVGLSARGGRWLGDAVRPLLRDTSLRPRAAARRSRGVPTPSGSHPAFRPLLLPPWRTRPLPWTLEWISTFPRRGGHPLGRRTGAVHVRPRRGTYTNSLSSSASDISDACAASRCERGGMVRDRGCSPAHPSASSARDTIGEPRCGKDAGHDHPRSRADGGSSHPRGAGYRPCAPGGRPMGVDETSRVEAIE